MNILITAGGTGGHIFPAILLFSKFLAEGNNLKIVCLQKDIELIDALKKYKEYCAAIPARPLPRKFDVFAIAKFMLSLFATIIDLRKIFKEFSPQVIVGLGGYVSFLPVIYAKLKKIPVVLCEQNSIPGLANRILAFIADDVVLNYEYSKKFIKKGKVIGNPVRDEIGKISKKAGYKFFNFTLKKKTILVMGGSQGARSINKVFAEIVKKLKNLQIIWCTGAKEFDFYKSKFSNRRDLKIFPLLEEIQFAYAIADLVICRAGATSLAEIQKVSLPAIIIPYPYATDNHQYYNALSHLESNKGIMIPDIELSVEKLFSAINELLSYKHKKRIMNNNATERIKELVYQNVSKNR